MLVGRCCNRQKQIKPGSLKGKTLTCAPICITITGVVFEAELQRSVFSSDIDLWQRNLTHDKGETQLFTSEELTDTNAPYILKAFELKSKITQQFFF